MCIITHQYLIAHVPHPSAIMQIAKQVDFVQEELKRLTDGTRTRPASAFVPATSPLPAKHVAFVSVDEAMERAAALFAGRKSQDGSN